MVSLCLLPQVQWAQRPVFGSALAQGLLNSSLLWHIILMPSPAIIVATTAMAMTTVVQKVFMTGELGNEKSRIVCGSVFAPQAGLEPATP